MPAPAVEDIQSKSHPLIYQSIIIQK